MRLSETGVSQLQWKKYRCDIHRFHGMQHLPLSLRKEVTGVAVLGFDPNAAGSKLPTTCHWEELNFSRKVMMIYVQDDASFG